MTPPTDAAVLGGITAESKEYFEKRSLKKGAVNWVLLMSLGIAYVISGDFSGWNYGIGYGGWFGMLIAFLGMGAMYLFMVLGLAEMSSAMPAAGAGYGFARRAMGKVGGALTGFAILIEYTICPAAISTFIAAYVHALGLFADIPSVAIIGFFFIAFVGIHLIGVGEALKIVFGITAIAMIALIAFVVGIAPHFEVANLFNIAPVVDGGTALLPFGVAGVMGLLIGSLSAGFVLAVFMANSGGAWDNAKKYIEEGNFGGKGGEVHRATVVGDTVGDPFKDTSGPSLNILIKLMSMVAIVMAGLTVSWSLF